MAKILELQLQHQFFQWIVRIDFIYNWLIWTPPSPRDSQESSTVPQFDSINSLDSDFFMVQLSCSYMTTGKMMALTMRTFVNKVMSLLFKMLPRSVTAFLPRSKHLLISWLQLPSSVILEMKKIKFATVSIFSSSICHDVMGLDAMILVLWMLNIKPAFSPSSRGCLVSLQFLPLEWYHLHSWDCWYFSQQSWF